MGNEPTDVLELVLRDYVERYGLTERARKYFIGQVAEEPEHAEVVLSLPHEWSSRDVCEDELPRLTWVIDELDRLARSRSKPRSIRVDKGPEFAGRLLDQWACLNKVELGFATPLPGSGLLANREKGKTDRQCMHRGHQQPHAPRMPERFPFLSMDDARCERWR